MKSRVKDVYKHLFVLYNILIEGGENVKLTLRYNITKIDKKQKQIIEEIMWHATKVYNMVLYELREGKRKIDVNKSIKIIQTEIYKEERKGTNIMSKRTIENPPTLDEIITAVNKEDLLCIEIVEEIGQKLGRQIAGLISIFNPELVIIGGTLSSTGDYIVQPIKTAIRKYSLNLVNKDATVTVSKLKDKAGVVGACMLARSRMFEI